MKVVNAPSNRILMRIYALFTAVFMVIISIDEMIVTAQDLGWFPGVLGIRLGYVLICILFVGLTFYDYGTVQPVAVVPKAVPSRPVTARQLTRRLSHHSVKMK